VLIGFTQLGDSLSTVTTQAALGQVHMEEQLKLLRGTLEEQRRAGIIDTGALQGILAGFGEEMCENIQISMQRILSSSSSSSSAHTNTNDELVKKIDLVLSMMSKMEEDITVIRGQTDKLMNLMKEVEARSNEFPRTFIISHLILKKQQILLLLRRHLAD
jgi:hypothetical protein